MTVTPLSGRAEITMPDPKPVITLFCFGVLPAFYEADAATRKEVFEVLVSSYSNLGERFGVKVLGTMDDDRWVVGPTFGWPWTCYILAEVPNHDAVTAVCNILRDFRVGESLLWKFMKVEARTGRELFFGNV
jgi:hypothetical protein